MLKNKYINILFRAVDDKIANLISDSLAFSWGMFLILIMFYLAMIIKKNQLNINKSITIY